MSRLSRAGQGRGRTTGVSPERRAVLLELKGRLNALGVANDAEDHWSGEEAVRLRREACERIRELLAEHAFLSELLPTLRWELERGSLVTIGWSRLEDDVDAWLAVTGARRGT